jgi:autotransporter-associated beta strand protein
MQKSCFVFLSFAAVMCLDAKTLEISPAYRTAFVRGENSGVASSCSAVIDGNVKLVKDGSGILTVKKSGQTYTGGTEVRGGTLKLGSNGNYAILPVGGTVTVRDGGTFEMDGYAGWNGRSFVLDGGTLQNSKDLRGSSGKWDAAASSANLLGNVTLTKDSTLRIRNTYGFNDGATLNLGGHMLRAEVAKDEILVLRSAVVSNGTINVVNGGWLYVPAEKTCDATDNAAILSSTALAIAGTLNVKDFTDAKTTNANSYDSSSGAINVYGTFTPKSDYFYGVTMQSGSSFDLSAKTEPWNVASSATDNNTVSFADNAAVGLALGERTIRGSIPVVTWVTAPANLDSLTFRRVDAGQERNAAKESSGIYFRTGLIISIY